MPIMPRTPVDLALAPVAAEIDLNLQRLRDVPLETLVEQILVSLNREPGPSRVERGSQVLEVAVRGVDLYGWNASLSADATRIQLRGGSVGLDLGLSATLHDYIETGV